MEQFSTALIPTRKGGGAGGFAAALRVGVGAAAAVTDEGITAEAVVPDFAGCVGTGATADGAGLPDKVCFIEFAPELASCAGSELDCAGSVLWTVT